MTNNYRQISRGIILQEDKILLAKASGRLNYHLPGGGINKFESAKEALQREIKEELGTSSEITAFLGIVENKWSVKNELFFETNYLFILNVNIPPKSNPSPKENGLIFEWKTLREIEFLTIYPSCLKKIIKDVVTKNSFETLWISNF